MKMAISQDEAESIKSLIKQHYKKCVLHILGGGGVREGRKASIHLYKPNLYDSVVLKMRTSARPPKGFGE